MKQENASLEKVSISSTAQTAEAKEAAAGAKTAVLPAEESVPVTLEDRVAALETLLDRQNGMLNQQMLLLEKQERRALYHKIWVAVKIVMVIVLVIVFAPKISEVWTQVNTVLTQSSHLIDSIETLISDVRTQMSGIMSSLSGLKRG